MLFKSYVFLFLFLPITLIGFGIFSALRRRNAVMVWLILCSLFFYGYWNIRYVPLLLGATVINYLLGVFWLMKPDARHRKLGLVIGLIFNLGLLGYFKYAKLFVRTYNDLAGTSFDPKIVLPLAISFFVFQKIAFLVDAYRGQRTGRNFLEFCLFVTFFPQLIAGPIVRPHEMLPQLHRRKQFGFTAANLSAGLTLFFLGLAKKVLIADSVTPVAARAFDAVAANQPIGLNLAWVGVLSYAIQIYFDFSGYSDMAIGLARLFGIRLPVNFNSPYQAINMIDFWRRWHITLSRVLRDYLYIPLGGNRKGPVRRYANLMLTMLLGGLWHGANWTFVIWGGLHGLYLMINHAWRALRRAPGNSDRPTSWLGIALSRFITFMAVVFAWVFFRADTFHAAGRMLAAMVGRNGLGKEPWSETRANWTAAVALLTVAFVMPNTQQILRNCRPALRVYPTPPSQKKQGWNRFAWEPSPAWAVGIAAVALLAVLHLARVSQFIYYQF